MENHQVIFKIHQEKNSVPNSLFFYNFPKPFFGYDQNFVEGYNQLINFFQDKCIKLIEDTIEQKIENLNQEIETIQNTIKAADESFNENFISDLYSYVVNQEEDVLKSYFILKKNIKRKDVNALTLK